MNYIATASVDWADEFNVNFCQVLSEEDYQKYKYLQETLKSFKGSLWFGTNEGWEGDFEFLDFEFKPITDEELKTLRKFKCLRGKSFWDSMIEDLNNYIVEICPELCHQEYDKYSNQYYPELNEDIFDISLDTFKLYIDTLVKAINEAS